MRKLMAVVFVVLFVLWAGSAFAVDLQFSWQASVGATGYKVQISTDAGVTWGEERDAGNNLTYTWLAAPDTGFLLFRFIAYNSAQTAIRSDAGVWYNGSWKQPGMPSTLGIQ